MQEPVLFNATIKENILYGQLDASDEQVLKVAEMANALTFIESNVEDLTKDERRDRNAKDLSDLLQKLSNEHPELIDIETSPLSAKEKLLLLQVLQKADKNALSKICQEPQFFIG